MSTFSFIQIFSVLCLCFYVTVVLYNITINRENECDMTMMFEYPQFVRIHVPENPEFIQYGLYAYSEGRQTERARKMRFDGVPVLFLPGNAGSHKQVRSLASIALRKAISSGHNFHFNYFTVDFNGELSGLFGGVLKKQTKFARYCLKAVLNLYSGITQKGYQKPKNIIIIGHSMGGIIAKGLLNNKTEELISLIITLASPLYGPVINFDHYMNSFYAEVDNYWRRKQSDTQNKDIVLISLSGGSDDLLVPSGLISSAAADFEALTTSIPGVWIAADHLAILWCRQLVLVLNRFLFSIIDVKSRQLTANRGLIIRNANYYIKTRVKDDILLSNAYIPNVKTKWLEDTRRQYSLQFNNGIPEIHNYMIRLLDLPNHQHLTIVTVNNDQEWLYGCTANDIQGDSRICTISTPLNQFSRWLSTAKGYGQRQIAFLDLQSLAAQNPKWTHVFVKVGPSRKLLGVNIDIHNNVSRSVRVNLPIMFSTSKRTIITITDSQAISYEIIFSDFEKFYQAYYLYVEPVDNCNGEHNYHASAEMIVPWASGHQVQHHFTNKKTTPLLMSLLKEKPFEAQGNLSVKLMLDQKCRFRVSYAGSIYDSTGQFVRHYTLSLIPIIAASIIMAGRIILSSMNESTSKKPISYYKALQSNGLDVFYLLILVNLGSTVLGLPAQKSLGFFSITHLATKLILTEPFSTIVLPFLQFLVALGFVHVIVAVGQLTLLLSGQIAHKLLIRLVWRGPGARSIAGLIRRIPGFVAAALTATVPASCGAVSLAAGALFYFFLLTKMYEEYLEEYFYQILIAFARRLLNKFRFKKADDTKYEENNQELLKLPDSPAHNESLIKQMITPCHDINTSGAEKTKLDKIKAIEPIHDKTLDGGDDENNGKNVSIVDLSDSVPNTSVAVPDIHKIVPDVQETIPDINKLVPDVHEMTPDISSLVPNIENHQLNPEVISSSGVAEDSQDKPQTTVKSDDAFSDLQFHFLMFTIWCLVTAVNIPSLITWAHNFKYNVVLESDPSFYPGMVMCISAGFLWQMDRPRKNLSYWGAINIFLYIIAIFILILGSNMFFCINYLVSIAFAVMTIHQVFAEECYSEVISTSQNGDSSSQTSADAKIATEEKSSFETFIDVKDRLESTDIE